MTVNGDAAAIDGDIKVEKGTGLPSDYAQGNSIITPTLAVEKTNGIPQLNGEWELQNASDHTPSNNPNGYQWARLVINVNGTIYEAAFTFDGGSTMIETGTISSAIFPDNYWGFIRTMKSRNYHSDMTDSTPVGTKTMGILVFDNNTTPTLFDMADTDLGTATWNKLP